MFLIYRCKRLNSKKEFLTISDEWKPFDEAYKNQELKIFDSADGMQLCAQDWARKLQNDYHIPCLEL